MREPRRFIQVLLGPRQVGKTTLVLQLAEEVAFPIHYISADLATLQDLSWIVTEWERARGKVTPKKGALLLIDEVQKIPNWSEVVKSLWDEDTRKKRDLRVMILGSSPWLMQKGLGESLAGRFELIPISHWSFSEMHELFGWPCNRFLYFGGYPGAVPLVDEKDQERWIRYIHDSLIETTLSRDLLLLTQVNKPVLLRRLFQLGCVYSGQILSYNKMLGQLHEAGNSTTLAHYLDLLSHAGLLHGIPKFAIQKVRQKGSSPKLMVFNTALMSAQSNKSFYEAQQDRSFWGRLVESAVGAYLLNECRGTSFEVFYWREGKRQVDFVVKKGEKLVAIEVKPRKETLAKSGMDTFCKKFSPMRAILVGDLGTPLEEFLRTPISRYFEA
ncbi:MAG: hypothetical protein K940chlam9_01746 [Chlamydiae bacterium]|nr:hypothetical protein [Chlamydiota bacterium]